MALTPKLRFPASHRAELSEEPLVPPWVQHPFTPQQNCLCVVAAPAELPAPQLPCVWGLLQPPARTL